MISIISFSAIAKNYDAFLVDVFGVLRHMKGPYPSAVKAVGRLQAEGKKVLFFSNTSDISVKGTCKRLNSEGLSCKEEHVITSGMALRLAFPLLELEAKPIISVGTDVTDEYVKEAGGHLTEDIGEAQASVLGYYLNDSNKARFELAVRLALEKNKPALLANTDLRIPVSENKTADGPGMIGEAFRERTRQKTYTVGKPAGFMYKLAYEKLRGVEKRKILAIGDSLDHDILGAQREKLDSVLVLTGLQGIISPGIKLEAWMGRKNIHPTHILTDLS